MVFNLLLNIVSENGADTDKSHYFPLIGDEIVDGEGLNFLGIINVSPNSGAPLSNAPSKKRCKNESFILNNY
jgi:hypothetical protein